MTTKLITFPARAKANVSDVEMVIRKWLFEISEDQALIDTVAARMMSFINNYVTHTFEPVFDLPAPAAMSEKEAQKLLIAIEKGIDIAAEQVQAMMNRIIVERFLLEIELYESQHYKTKTALIKRELRQK